MGFFMRKNRTSNKKKVVVVFFLCMALLAVLAGRLFYLMVFRSEYYSEKAEDLHEREREIKRGKHYVKEKIKKAFLYSNSNNGSSRNMDRLEQYNCGDYALYGCKR